LAWSITGWLDPLFKPFADWARIPVSDYSAHVGGEVLGTTVEYGSEFLTRPLLAKSAEFFSGLGCLLVGWFARVEPERLRRELVQIGTHLLLRIGKPTSIELFMLRRNVEDITSAIQKQDWNKLMRSLVYSPPEIQSAVLNFLGIPSPRPPAPAVEKGTYTPPVEIPPTETPPTEIRGKYVVTE
jgi:hypothetical protein